MQRHLLKKIYYFKYKMIFISFFTSNGKYPFFAKKLQSSLEKFNLQFDIQEISPFNSWAEGCRYKSTFILQMLLKHRKSVIWMDIDTEVWQFPELLFEIHDFCIYNWIADSNHHLDGKIPFNLNSTQLFCSGGVQKWGYTAPAIELLIHWINMFKTENNWEKGDDPLLDLAYNKYRPPVTPLWLPKTYNRMDKFTSHWSDIISNDVVINHDYTAGDHRK